MIHCWDRRNLHSMFCLFLTDFLIMPPPVLCPQVTLPSALHVTTKWKQTPCWSTCVPASSVSVLSPTLAVPTQHAMKYRPHTALWFAFDMYRSAPLSPSRLHQLYVPTSSFDTVYKFLAKYAKLHFSDLTWPFPPQWTPQNNIFWLDQWNSRFCLSLRYRRPWRWSSVTNEQESLKSLYGRSSV